MSLSCEKCGETLKVPTIRNLGSLKLVEAEVVKPTTSKNSVWLSILAAIAFIVGSASLAYVGSVTWEHFRLLALAKEYKMDLTKTEEDYVRDGRESSKNATPADTWDYWNEMVANGLADSSTPDFFRIKRYIESQKPIMARWGTVAAISFLTFFGLTWLHLRRKARTV